MAASLALTSEAVAANPFRLPQRRDVYFMEDNVVYSRFLMLMRDGTYRQINKDQISCAEVDRGSWEQSADGTVRLHSTHQALRFRALLSGPLAVTLGEKARIDALPCLAANIRTSLDATGDRIFAKHTFSDLDAPPALVSMEKGAETYSRADLQSLLRQVDNAVLSERTRIFLFTPLNIVGTPILLVLHDAVFQATDLPRVKREYKVRPKAAPPFYFAQVDARTFEREVGAWREFRYAGGAE